MKNKRKMKKMIDILLATFLCLGLAACGKDVDEKNEIETSAVETDILAAPTEPVSEVPRLCVIYNGILGNDAYNDAFAAGVYNAADEFQVEVTALEGVGEVACEANVLAACEAEYDFVIGASPEIGEWIAKYGAEYPQIQFAVMDVTVDLPNVHSVYFSHEESFFLAGAAAAKMTGAVEVSGINEEAVIGWIAGMNIPVLQEYFEAFKQGASYVNSEIRILESYVGSWSDGSRAREVTMEQFDQGADIIMNVASSAGEGIREAAIERGLYVLEAEQNAGIEGQESVLASITEYADRAGYLIVKGMAEERFFGGSSTSLSLRDGAVGLTDFDSLRDAFGDDYAEELKEQCRILADMLSGGEAVIKESDETGDFVEETIPNTDLTDVSVQKK